MKKFNSCVAGFLLALTTLAVSAVPVGKTPPVPEVFRPTVKVGFAPDMQLDSAMDSPLWQKMPSYRFMRYVTDINYINLSATEGAEVRYLYNKETFFVRVDMIDSDVMTSATENQNHHYIMGDVVEVFVKPANDTYYWEVYGTPNKLYTRFYFPAGGSLGLPSCFGPTDVKIGVDARVDGTFNNQNDRDRSWSVIIAIPRRELEKNGCKFEKGSAWTILASRYNYSRFLPIHELSSFPQIFGGYHATKYYANIEFINLETENK